MEQTKKSENPGQGQGNDSSSKIHIFINNRKYEQEDGVKPIMTPREMADLIPVDPEKAEVTYKNKDQKLPLDEPINLKNGDHFEIIRTSVTAGNDGRN